MFRKMLMAIPIVTIAVGSTTACATKKFVRTSVGEVNGKVDSLGRSVEETQERTRQNEGKINEVDQRAQAAAAAAKTAADSANSAAMAADGKAVAANERVEAVDKASKRLVFEVVLSEDQGNFKFGKKDLPDEAKAKLDELVNQLKADPKGAFFEIEGAKHARHLRRGRDQRAGEEKAEDAGQRKAHSPITTYRTDYTGT